MTTDIATWEDERGAVRRVPGRRPILLTGTPSQVEWAEGLRRRVSAEFDRVAASFRSVAARHSGAKRADTEAILDVLESKRADVMDREHAGYFIHEWPEPGDRVRQMIAADARFQAIRI